MDLKRFRHAVLIIIRGISNIPVWQRNYWERILRNEQELNKIRKYIRDNPEKW